MSGRVFTYSMPAGIPGNISRQVGQAKVEAQIIDPTDYPTLFGVGVAIDATSHKLRKIKAGDTGASVVGLYVRPYPTTGGSGSDPMGTSTPPTSGIGNLLKSGYMTVLLRGATAAAKQGIVYVRVASGDSDHPLGGFEAADDGSNTDVLTGAYFTGPADADGNVEIAYNI